MPSATTGEEQMSEDLRLSALGAHGLKIVGFRSSMQIGRSVGAAGDFNGDGISDFVISGPFLDNSNDRRAVAYVIFGDADGALPSVDLSRLDASEGFRITSPAGFDGVDFNVASAGDVDGDGYGDLVIGMPRYDRGFGTRFTGQSFILYGHGGEGRDVALNETTDRVTTVFESSPAYSGQDGPLLGVGGKAIGDLNGDGREDFAISAYYDSTLADYAGRVYVIYGGTDLGSSFDIDRLTSQGFFVTGSPNSQYVGGDFAGLGDINGDGFGDFTVTGRNNEQDIGYVLFGSADLQDTKVNAIASSEGFRILDSNSGIQAIGNAGDVNGDGYEDIIVGEGYRCFVIFGHAGEFETIDLRSLSANAGFEISAAVGSGTVRVSAAGDVNGDGYDDVAMFNYAYYSGLTSIGFVIYGHGGAFAKIDATKMDAATGFTIRSGQAEDLAGYALTNAGDVNNDGVDDLLIGAGSAGSNYQGAAYLIYGETPTTMVDLTGTVAGQRLAGGAFDDVLAGVGGDDTLFGNAGADELDGGDGDDLLDGGLGADRMIGGAGDDVFRVDAGDAVVEAADAGYDTVEAAVSWRLGKNVEALVLGGRANAQGTGNGLDNHLTGNAGANVLKGSGGDDWLEGRDGDDTLDGGTGANRLAGGAGDDSYVVRSAADVVIEAAGSGHDRVRASVDIVLGDNVEDLTLFGLARAGSGNVLNNGIDGNDRGNILLGLDGADRLIGAGGDDLLDGGSGNDRLDGGDGRDTLLGGDGEDRLFGGTGKDTLTGGAGRDVFRFAEEGVARTLAEADTVTDFSQADRDKLDLSDTDGVAGYERVDPFVFVGTAEFSGRAGDLRYEFVGKNTIVSADTNSDRVADVFIRLEGRIALTASDFVFARVPEDALISDTGQDTVSADRWTSRPLDLHAEFGHLSLV